MRVSGLPIVTSSRYTQAGTLTVAPGAAASICAWSVMVQFAAAGYDVQSIEVESSSRTYFDVQIYDGRTISKTEFGDTTVLNAYGARELRIDAK